MNYKKDMLLILTVIFMLGAAIQTARTDLIPNIASDRRLSGKMGGNYSLEYGKEVKMDRAVNARSPILYFFYNSMKAQ